MFLSAVTGVADVSKARRERLAQAHGIADPARVWSSWRAALDPQAPRHAVRAPALPPRHPLIPCRIFVCRCIKGGNRFHL